MKSEVRSYAGFILFCLIMLPAFGCAKKNMETQKEKVGYSIGWDIGNNLKSQGIDADLAFMKEGIKDALDEAQPRLTLEERREVMRVLSDELQKKQTEGNGELSAKNKKEGEAFLKQNSKKEGVKTTSSGLQYKVIKKGTGASPSATDKVTVHYSGTLIDGTEFDSSYKRGEPATFPLNGVIRGWTEALQLMKEGGKCELYIPSELGYGERGSGRTIGPGAVLIFTVELISVNK
ncbi:MAG: FKBP-type peptidyl-prolyl cis-trans isomerase [Elusimicrobiota bacterium]|nr:FKBP-type peptidyl-prolyl cis-trans isomerase [Elusimicrobiota bacterium]